MVKRTAKKKHEKPESPATTVGPALLEAELYVDRVTFSVGRELRLKAEDELFRNRLPSTIKSYRIHTIPNQTLDGMKIGVRIFKGAADTRAGYGGLPLELPVDNVFYYELSEKALGLSGSHNTHYAHISCSRYKESAELVLPISSAVYAKLAELAGTKPNQYKAVFDARS